MPAWLKRWVPCPRCLSDRNRPVGIGNSYGSWSMSLRISPAKESIGRSCERMLLSELAQHHRLVIACRYDRAMNRVVLLVKSFVMYLLGLILPARLFVTSYAPLFGILAVRFDGGALRIVCATLCALGLLGAIFTIWAVGRKNPERVLIKHVEDAGGQATGYLASYLLPFVTVSQPTERDVIAYVIFIFVAFMVYAHSDMIQVNPTFYLLGRKILRIQMEHGSERYVISKYPTPSPGDEVDVVWIKNVLLEVGSRNVGC